MTSNQAMDYYVRPWHLYSHSRTCTRRRLCRIPSRVVAFYAISLIVPVFIRFQLSCLILVYVRCFQPLWRSWSIIYLQSSWRSWRFYDSLYCTWRWPNMLYCIMPIHGHCTLLYPGLVYLFAVMYRVVSLYSVDWMAGSSTGFFITSLLGWTYNVFRPSYDPSSLTH